MTKIDEAMVRHVALLSRLTFSGQEIEEFTDNLNRILEYVDKLNELDTQEVKPTSHSLPMANVFRGDEARPSLSAEEALKNAPEKEKNCFKVPKIIQEY